VRNMRVRRFETTMVERIGEESEKYVYQNSIRKCQDPGKGI